jgi:hypothetical protein
MEVSEAIRKIERIPTITEKAKHHMKQLVEFCQELGGEVTSIRTPEEVYEGYDFASVRCNVKGSVKVSEIRRTSSKIEIITKDNKWKTLMLTHPTSPPPTTVIFQDLRRRPQQLRYYYLGETGIDTVEGEFPVGGFDASVLKDGRYINIALGW